MCLHAGDFEPAAKEHSHVFLAYALNVVAELIQRVADGFPSTFQLSVRLPVSFQRSGTVESLQL